MSDKTPIKTRSQAKRNLSVSFKSERKSKRTRIYNSRRMESEKSEPALIDAQRQIDQLNSELLRVKKTYKEQLDLFRAELNNLLQLNHAQNEQLINIRKNSLSPSVNNNQQIFQTLIDGLRMTHLDVKPPTFDGSQNPQNFLDKLEKFFIVKQIPDTNRLIYLDAAFLDKAKLWFEIQSLQTYTELKKNLLVNFILFPCK